MEQLFREVKEDGAIYGSIPDSATDDKMMRRQ
jgi:hypothetical protein